MPYRIESAQTTIHPDLAKVLRRARGHKFDKPFNKQVVREFEKLCGLVDPKAQPLVLDSFCGTGHSTLALATRYPDAFVIGFDQSEERLKKRRQP